jgi:hypothetical protein
MVLFPEVARKAQAEIDIVVGCERLPTFKDRPRLPYINALIKEVLRWNSVTPLGKCIHNVDTKLNWTYVCTPKQAALIAQRRTTSMKVTLSPRGRLLLQTYGLWIHPFTITKINSWQLLPGKWRTTNIFTPIRWRLIPTDFWAQILNRIRWMLCLGLEGMLPLHWTES